MFIAIMMMVVLAGYNQTVLTLFAAFNNVSHLEPTMTSSSYRMLAAATSIMAFNVVQRIITFVLNQVMISRTSPEVFGMAAISLELLLSTLLFLSREGIRLACLREKVISVTARQRLINLSWIPSLSLVTVVMSLLVLRSLWTTNNTEIMKPLGAFQLDIVLMYSLGAFLELCGEPWFNLFQCNGKYEPRLKADTMAVFVRSITTCYTVAWLDLGVHGFGYAQMSYGLTHVLMMMSASHQGVTIDGVPLSWSDYLPRLVPINPSTSRYSTSSDSNPASITNDTTVQKGSMLDAILDLRTASVALRATFSSLLKHVLTEADKIALSFTSSPYDQGIFAVANNYGSLVTRMVLLPIEESARLNFSSLAAELRQLEKHSQGSIQAEPQRANASAIAVPLISPSTTTKKEITSSDKTDTTSIADVNQSAGTFNDVQSNVMSDKISSMVHALESLLDQLLLVVSLLGVAFLIFGPCYSRVVVRLLFARPYQSEESIRTLAMVSVNVFVLALNGVTEAFVHAVMPPTDFFRVNLGFVASSVAYVLLVGPSIARAGTCGLGIPTLSIFSQSTSLDTFPAYPFNKPSPHLLK